VTASAPGNPAAPILDRAARALGRIDRDGPRAITTLSVAEIEAMALALVLLGLAPIPPGTPFEHPSKEPSHDL
jgi:hypothetical protein